MRGFREIREIKEVKETKTINPDEENFKKIKPETDMTVEEAREILQNLFLSMEVENCE